MQRADDREDRHRLGEAVDRGAPLLPEQEEDRGISVPAWPIPIQKTKFVMSQAQATGLLLPQTPMPSQNR